ncbi:MAG: hypothetical protein NTW21_28985 [Verrucomicrobia bacterium]|nr:hypothetical protein [Verrucomicrobiota bacterium]
MCQPRLTFLAPPLAAAWIVIAWCAAAAIAGPPSIPDAAVAVVAKHNSVFTEAPRGTPSNWAVDAPLLGNGDLLAALGGAGGEPEFWISTNDFWQFTQGLFLGGPRPLARLALRFPELAGGGWQAEQEFTTAVTTLRMTKGERVLRLRAWVAATENLLVVELNADGKPLGGRVELIARGITEPRPPRPIHLGREQYGGGRWYLNGCLDEVQVFDRALTADALHALRERVNAPDGIVRHWAFDETEGDAARDSASPGGAGVLRNAARTPGVRGGAVRLNGRDAYIECPALSIPGTFTISAWALLDAAVPEGQAAYLFSMGEWSQGCSLGISGGKLRLAVDQTFAQSAEPVPVGRWVHLAGTFDGRRLTVYVDGREAGCAAVPEPPDEASVERTPQVQRAARRFARDVAIPSAAACAVRLVDGKLPDFTLEPGRPLVLAVAVRSEFKDPGYLEAVTRRVEQATPEDIAAVRTRHLGWWREYWGRSTVELDDPVIEQRYYLSHYVMGSCSRDPKFPPNIFGWITTDRPEWQGDYHLNYNHMAPFYGLYSSNRLEQALPYHAPLLDFLERGRFYARSILGIRGVYLPVGIGPLGLETNRVIAERRPQIGEHNRHVEGEGYFMGQKSNAAYALVNVAQHWYATYDPDYGRTLYPLVLAVADFWEDYLKFEGGRHVIYSDSIHEGSGPDFNPVLSLGLVRNAFALALDMSRELGVDAGRHPRWQHILEHLSDYPVQQRDGKTVFRYSEKGMDWCWENTLGIQHIYPAAAIGLDSTPKLLEISRDTITALGRWGDQNGMNSFYPAAVRVGYDPDIIWNKLGEVVRTLGAPNGFTRGNPHGIENCSIVPNTINEMMLLSHEGVLRLFRVWPRGHNGRFSHLRARGAFLVSAAITKGVVSPVTVLSERGRDLVIENPWPGRAVVVTRNGRQAETVTGERLKLKTAVGEALALTPPAP